MVREWQEYEGLKIGGLDYEKEKDLRHHSESPQQR